MIKENNVFDFLSYKPYLVAKLGRKSERKGLRSGLAKKLSCQPTFVSQVLNGSAEFNLEQGEKISEFLGHTYEEKHYFLLLMQKDRSGTSTLRQHFEGQLQEIRDKRMVLIERLEKRSGLSKESQMVYYSSWLYAACHIALTIPSLQSRESLADYFRVPMARVSEVVEFLVESGLAEVQQKRLISSQKNIRIGRDSKNLLKHHTNLRTQALVALDREALDDLHYSSVFSLSKKDKVRVKELLLSFIEDNAKLVQASGAEELCALTLDFFSMGEGS